MSILSIQSHVAYGYVGNKASVYPLQAMGFDVWPVHTVQFSNHTGYGQWQGEIFSSTHIENIIYGIEKLGVASTCKAVLSGYMGSAEICYAVQNTVNKFRDSYNQKLIYLCDPVIGNNSCYVKPEVLEFFRKNLMADIITPNQFEAEILSDIQINDISSLKKVAAYFHNLNIKIVIITGIKFTKQNDANIDSLYVFLSDINDSDKKQYIIQTKEYHFPIPINGTGDLFSALYLGHYLLTFNSLLALQKVIFLMEKVLNVTEQSLKRELQVLKIKYDIPVEQYDLPVFQDV